MATVMVTAATCNQKEKIEKHVPTPTEDKGKLDIIDMWLREFVFDWVISGNWELINHRWCTIKIWSIFPSVKFAEIATQTVGIGNILTNMDAAFHHSYHSPSAPLDSSGVLGINCTISQPSIESGGNKRETNGSISAGGVVGEATAAAMEDESNAALATNQTDQLEKPGIVKKAPAFEGLALNNNNNNHTNGSTAGAMKNMNSDVFL